MIIEKIITMGMPYVEYVYQDMQEDVFGNFPEICQILWQENENCDPELRIKTTYAEKIYDRGRCSELHLASPELQELWPEIVSVLKSTELRGWGEYPDTVYIMDKSHISCPAEEYPQVEDEEY